MSNLSFFLSENDYFKNYLKETPGVPQERFKAFELPSLVNGKRIPATRVKACLVGGPRPNVHQNHTDSGPIEI